MALLHAASDTYCSIIGDLQDCAHQHATFFARRLGHNHHTHHDSAQFIVESTRGSTEYLCATQQAMRLDAPSNTAVGQLVCIIEPQLVNEVKGIYAGLVMVEWKYADMINQQTKLNKYLADQQWKALVALHRTLLQEHHSFFSASQHPTTSDALKILPTKHAMPARMRRHAILTFLELLRHPLPDSMQHMLSFIHLAYSMMALLKESVPSFVETWIICLGHLARYRIAIEDTNPRDRDVWSNVAKMWYNEVVSGCSDPGRMQHHLAMLARPNSHRRLFDNLASRICSRLGKSSGCSVALCLFSSMIRAVHALPSDMNASIPASEKQPNSYIVPWTIFLYALCCSLICCVPFFGPKYIANDAITVSSIMAFGFSLAVSAGESLDSFRTWSFICTGLSLGASMWLWRVTRARKNSILFTLLRYLVPAAIIWQLLLSSSIGDRNHSLSLSDSIPSLSVFWAVSLNAFINETFQEIVTFLCRIWEGLLRLLELERIRPTDMV